MIDFHCHIDLYPDPLAVVRECRARGVYVLSVTNTPSAWHGTNALAEEAPRIRTALGLHPQLAGERHGELALFEELVGRTRYVGEVGLDGGTEFRSSQRQQAQVFSRILTLCSNIGGRVLSIHSRRATTAVLEALRGRPAAGVPILHWFSGTAAELADASAIGCWFSIGPSMLAGKKGAALVARMPMERVLTETDGPFTGSDQHPHHPWDAARAVDRLAAIWRLPENEVRARLRDNLAHLAAALPERSAD